MILTFAEKLIAYLAHVEYITLYALLAIFASPWIAGGALVGFSLLGATIAMLDEHDFI